MQNPDYMSTTLSPMKRGRNANEQFNATADDATTAGETRTNAYQSGQKIRQAKKGSVIAEHEKYTTLHLPGENQNEFPTIVRGASKKRTN